MDLPSVQFSDVLCPRSKPPPRSKAKSDSAADIARYQRQVAAAQVILHDANKAFLFPVGRDAFLQSVFQPYSLVVKYNVSEASSQRQLRALGTCLPFGRPNQLITLQDHCSSIIPLAVQTQEWLQAFRAKKKRSQVLRKKVPIAAPAKRKHSSDSSSSSESEESDEESVREEDDDISSTGEDEDEDEDASTSPSSSDTDEDEANTAEGGKENDKGPNILLHEPSLQTKVVEEEEISLPPLPVKKVGFRNEPVVEVDPSLPFDELAHMPNFKYIKPLRKDSHNIQGTYLTTRAAAGYADILPPLRSSINWWYSGGNLAHLSLPNDQHFLFHPAGGSFRQKTSLQATPFRLRDSRSFRCVTAEKNGHVQLEVNYPILQMCVQNLVEEVPLLLSRQARKCQIYQPSSAETGQLSLNKIFSIDNEQLPRLPLEPYYFTHAAFSPYVPSEFVVATQTGQVSLYSVAHGRKLATLSIASHDFKTSAVHSWTASYFGASPRIVAVATPAAVQLFDLRTKARNCQLQLLKKSDFYTDVADNIVAAEAFPFLPQFHTILSTKEMLVIDERFASKPVLRYPSQTTTSLAYLRGLRGVEGGHADVVCCASQMSQDVMVHEMQLAGGSTGSDVHLPPHMLTTPFLCAAPRQISAQCAIADLSVESGVKHRLEKPITGLDIFDHPSGKGISCVTVSALGDVFVQSFAMKEEDDDKENVVTGNGAFSTIYSECSMSVKEQAYLSKWLRKASLSVEDSTSHQHERAFYPDSLYCDLTEDLLGHLQYSSMTVNMDGLPECIRCNERPKMVVKKEEDEASPLICPRCHLSPTDDRPVVVTGPNRFCYYRKNTSQAPVSLPEEFRRDVKLREMAQYNRLLHRLMTECYYYDIPTNQLQPPSPDGKSSESSEEESDKNEIMPVDNRPDPFHLRTNLTWTPGLRVRGNFFPGRHNGGRGRGGRFNRY